MKPIRQTRMRSWSWYDEEGKPGFSSIDASLRLGGFRPVNLHKAVYLPSGPSPTCKPPQKGGVAVVNGSVARIVLSACTFALLHSHSQYARPWSSQPILVR
jgi:hypothetical protein